MMSSGFNAARRRSTAALPLSPAMKIFESSTQVKAQADLGSFELSGLIPGFPYGPQHLFCGCVVQGLDFSEEVGGSTPALVADLDDKSVDLGRHRVPGICSELRHRFFYAFDHRSPRSLLASVARFSMAKVTTSGNLRSSFGSQGSY